MDFSRCSNDQSLGPAVQGCRDNFDFTIKFEQVFFSILPASIFIALCLPRIVYLAHRRAIVGGYFLRPAKVVFICVYSALQLSLLILSSIIGGRFESFFVSSSALTFATALCMIIVSHLEHSRSPRPSILLTAFLSLSILLDAAQTRTLWLASTTGHEKVFTKLFTTAVAVKFLAALLEAQQKVKWVRWDAKEHSPEETSGLFDLGAFIWLNRLFLTGYRKTLTLDDLFSLDQSMATEKLQAKLSHSFDKISPSNRRRHGLAQTLAKSLAIPLLLPIGPRIAMTALQFCQPFLINLLLDYLQKTKGEFAENIGYGLIGATFLVYSGIAFSGALYWYLQERAMYMIRGVLAGAVYRKIVGAKLSATDDMDALTLMSADIERIIMGGLNLHEFWANTIQVGLASWLLYREIGPAAVAPLIVVLCCVMSSSVLSKFTGSRQKAWMEKIQKRVGVTANVIRQMKHLKISGLATIVEESIQSMRVNELKTASRFRVIITIAAVIANVPLCISPVVTFIFASHTLDIRTIFTAIAYIMLLATPLSVLLQMMPAFLSTFTCLERVQKFLEKESRFDFRRLASERQKKDITQVLTEKDPAPEPLMKISDGSFGWQEDKFIISHIDLEIPASSLTMVVGPVASGKSTLCKALIGEAPFARGQVHISSNNLIIGYCDQTPYLSNSTIRENIVGFAPFKQARYDEVLEATMLKPDLASLMLSDDTKVGSNGITLSGGQKQRVALARALYLDSDFLVFDDVLSGLDADTAESIFRNIFSAQGLLRRRGVTTILCTHAIQRLPSANHIIALRSDGSLEEQGTFADLMANKGYVHSLGVQENEDTHVQDDTPTTNSIIPTHPKSPNISGTGPLPPNFGDEKKRMTGDISVYRHYFSRLDTISLVLFIAFGIGWGFFSNFTTIWLKFWSEDVSSMNPTHSSSFYIGLYALFQISTLACLLCICLVCFKSMIQVSGAKLHKEALSTVVNAPLKFFTSTDTGIITNLFSQDMNLIDGELPLALINVVNRLFISIGMAAVVATSSVYLIITFPVLAIVLYWVQKFYLRTSRQIRLLDLEAKSPLYSQFIDTIKGVTTIRAFGWDKEVVALNNQLLDDSQRPAYLLAMIQRWLQFILQLVVAALATTVVALATQLRSSSGFAGASLVTLMTFGNSLAFLIRVYTVAETSMGAVSRLKTFCESVKLENLPGENVVPPPEWPMRGDIEIRGVSASYEETEDASPMPSSCTMSNQRQDSPHLALTDLNLSIAAGEKVSICGRTGSGKSSVILLILRLLDPLSSCRENVTIDNTPLNLIDRSTLRQRIVAVPQDPVFLPDGTSFQSNLDAQGLSTEVECNTVLKLVGLQAIVDESGGLNGAMTADSLSQGQKQLFSLARAILRRRAQSQAREAALGEKTVSGDGGVLLLDEFSSNVDRETEKVMQKIIGAEFKGYTVVMVSHRLDMVIDFDTVVVMDAGRIVETGRPNELVQIEGSRFGDLWKVENKGRTT